MGLAGYAGVGRVSHIACRADHWLFSRKTLGADENLARPSAADLVGHARPDLAAAQMSKRQEDELLAEFMIWLALNYKAIRHAMRAEIQRDTPNLR